VEVTVVQFHGITDAALILVDHELIIQTKFALRSSREVSTHLNVTVNVGPKDSAWGRWVSFSAKQEDYVPFALMFRLTVSMTSTKASFFLYFTSTRRQLVAPVAWVVIFEDSSCDIVSQVPWNDNMVFTIAIAEDTMLSVVIYVLRVSISLFCGYPKSLISVPR